ncbi:MULTISPECIES: hypothetical protein [Marinobacter]|uniref:hypothetical protein n=1 Tax=Marinobacter TaxID=2742 RepID=UPI000C94038B|nr:hypothetical protein [Marinobacter sp.]MAC24728.1 hypothetical protein [Marinobacter sp.]|tara:strand:+ start:422 stop:1798 length:1377 start_codon:yes stop_codon:yes gene_type:complete
MIGTEIPPEILITALASRLVDLQSARIDEGAAQLKAPEPTPNAEHRAYVAAALVFSLDKALLDGATEFVGIQSLHQRLQDSGYMLSEEQLRFSARFLGSEREIRYLNEDNEPLTTRNLSQLVRYQARQDRVKLTMAGQQFVRMVRHTGEWLYADKDVEKLSIAIRSGLFSDIGRLCGEIQTTLRMQNERITALRENPSSEVFLAEYLEHREHFSEMLDSALKAALDAKENLGTEDTRRRLDIFNSARPDYPIHRRSLYDVVSVVHQATESLSRNWSGLLKDLQNDKRQQMGVLRFDRILDAFVNNPPTEKAMTAFLAGCCGWIQRPQIIGVDAIIGKLSPAMEPKEKPDIVFDMDPAADEANTELQSWIARNGPAILKALEQGPIHLVDLITNAGLPDCPIQSITEFGEAIGIYSIHDDEEELLLEVVQLPEMAKIEGWDHHIGVTNVALRHRVREEN